MQSLESMVVLASQSPRRRELLDQIDIGYRVMPVDIDETPRQGEAADEYVQRLAIEKAEAARRRLDEPSLPVIAADTAVVLGEQILGKPTDRAQAAQMLAQLSGREHRVMTAVAVADTARVEHALSVSRVQFAALDEAQIKNYLASGEADDKAGAYAIQGLAAVFVQSMSGSYSGIVGLPLFETAQLLERFGVRAASE